MFTRVLRTAGFVLLPAMTSLLMLGCSGTGLPDTDTVALPDGTQVQATMNSGVISFANSSWEFVRTGESSAQGAVFVIVEFGPSGELASFMNFTMGQEFFGSEILFDGERHNSTVQSVQYAAATYGAQTADARGFAFKANLNAFAPVVGQVANATATASGQFDGDDINTVRGTFVFESHVTNNMFGAVPDEYVDIEDTMFFVGHRITD